VVCSGENSRTYFRRHASYWGDWSSTRQLSARTAKRAAPTSLWRAKQRPPARHHRAHNDLHSRRRFAQCRVLRRERRRRAALGIKVMLFAAGFTAGGGRRKGKERRGHGRTRSINTHMHLHTHAHTYTYIRIVCRAYPALSLPNPRRLPSPATSPPPLSPLSDCLLFCWRCSVTATDLSGNDLKE